MRVGGREERMCSEPVGGRSWATELPCFFSEMIYNKLVLQITKNCQFTSREMSPCRRDYCIQLTKKNCATHIHVHAR